MPSFICEKCGCVDNSACGGTYWGRGMKLFKGDADKMLLCAACTPDTYANGEPNERGGKWHNRFPRRMPDGSDFTQHNK